MFGAILFNAINTFSECEKKKKMDLLLFKRFLLFMKEVSYAHQGCIYLVKNRVKTVILWNIITI